MSLCADVGNNLNNDTNAITTVDGQPLTPSRAPCFLQQNDSVSDAGPCAPEGPARVRQFGFAGLIKGF